MNILAIDTSNDVLGIALLTEEKIIAENITNLKRNHSVRVMPAIETVMADCGMKPADLDKIVVAKGPGSYTGVRIGVTIAKMMAWSLNIPLVGVSSLAALAASSKRVDGYIVPLFDARRGRIYTGLYRYDGKTLVCVKEDCNVSAVEWAESLKGLDAPVFFIGNDVSIHEESLRGILGESALFSDVSEGNPRPGALGMLGIDQQAEEIHTFAPNYTRLVEAEAKWLEKQEKSE